MFTISDCKLIIILFIILIKFINLVSNHGMMLNPLNRASMWRKNPDMLADYDDDGSFCGGFNTQMKNKGKCGICGDNYRDPRPRAHELGGLFGSGKIAAKYKRNSTVIVRINLTTNHRGWFKFDICNIDKQKQKNANTEIYNALETDKALSQQSHRDSKMPRFSKRDLSKFDIDAVVDKPSKITKNKNHLWNLSDQKRIGKGLGEDDYHQLNSQKQTQRNAKSLLRGSIHGSFGERIGTKHKEDLSFNQKPTIRTIYKPPVRIRAHNKIVRTYTEDLAIPKPTETVPVNFPSIKLDSSKREQKQHGSKIGAENEDINDFNTAPSHNAKRIRLRHNNNFLALENMSHLQKNHSDENSKNLVDTNVVSPTLLNNVTEIAEIGLNSSSVLEIVRNSTPVSAITGIFDVMTTESFIHQKKSSDSITKLNSSIPGIKNITFSDNQDKYTNDGFMHTTTKSTRYLIDPVIPPSQRTRKFKPRNRNVPQTLALDNSHLQKINPTFKDIIDRQINNINVETTTFTSTSQTDNIKTVSEFKDSLKITNEKIAVKDFPSQTPESTTKLLITTPTERDSYSKLLPESTTVQLDPEKQPDIPEYKNISYFENKNVEAIEVTMPSTQQPDDLYPSLTTTLDPEKKQIVTENDSLQNFSTSTSKFEVNSISPIENPPKSQSFMINDLNSNPNIEQNPHRYINEHLFNIRLSEFDDAIFTKKTSIKSDSSPIEKNKNKTNDRISRRFLLKSLINYDSGNSLNDVDNAGKVKPETEDDLNDNFLENESEKYDFSWENDWNSYPTNPRKYDFPLNLETEECFETLYFADGDDLYFVNSEQNIFDIEVKLPDDLKCEHCIFRWYYRAGNNWGVCSNGVGGEGCGPQETFINCADVSIQ